MGNVYFRFKQFTVWQDRCGMKVGTDGTLLGAWANGGNSILDIGTGTGLIALMMAQRFPKARLVGIDIDPEAVAQAQSNVSVSPFSSRVEILLQDVADAVGQYDALVCNPPFFTGALKSPDAKRTLARHADTLSYRQLMHHAWRLLCDTGELSVVIPADCRGQLENEALLAGFFMSRECAVKTTWRKPPKRFLLAFRKHPVAPLPVSLTLGTAEAHALTEEFYL